MFRVSLCLLILMTITTGKLGIVLLKLKLLQVIFFNPFFLLRFVEWEDFADHAMVHNPRGGTAVLPKMITAVSTGVDSFGGAGTKKSPKKTHK